MYMPNPYPNNNTCSRAKCENCNLGYVCSKSPYCILSEIVKSSNKIDEVNVNMIQVHQDIITQLVQLYETLNNKVDEMSQKIDTPSTVTNTRNTNNISNQKETINNNNDTAIAVVDDNFTRDQVLIEKKGLFGKSKWVVDK